MVFWGVVGFLASSLAREEGALTFFFLPKLCLWNLVDLSGTGGRPTLLALPFESANPFKGRTA